MSGDASYGGRMDDHANVTVFLSDDGRRWGVSCGCGWRSTVRETERDAVVAAIRHVRLVQSGAWYRPKFPGGPTYAEATAALRKPQKPTNGRGGRRERSGRR